MRIFIILCTIIILACLYQSTIEPFFQGYYPSDFMSNTIPCDGRSLPGIY